MAEVLVKARAEYSPSDPAKARAVWRAGEPVVVREDGWAWGREERLPRFAVVKLPGVPAAKLAFLEEQYEQDPSGGLVEGATVVLNRRVMRLGLATLPGSLRTQLAAGVVTTDWPTLRDHITSQRDGTTLAGRRL